MERRRQRLPKRVKRGLPVKRRVLVICDGEKTEPFYFYALKVDERVARKFVLDIRSIKPGATRQQTIVRHAKDRDTDEIWCVFDTECPADKSAINAIEAIAQENRITICWSNPAFEVWLLSHFERPGAVYLNCQDVMGVLNGHWRKKFGREYSKSDRGIGQLAGLVQDAVDRCAWADEHHHKGKPHCADKNSSSSVYRLIQRLLPKPTA